jgi:hypothetical protein
MITSRRSSCEASARTRQRARRVLCCAILAGASGCASVTPPAKPETIEIGDYHLRELHGEAEVSEYLNRLMALELERQKFQWPLWERQYDPDAETGFGLAEFSIANFGASKIEDVAMLASFTQSIVVTGESASGEASSITNNQESDVDEGDIVKRVGNHVLLLRRGRLFSFDIGPRTGFALRLVDRIDVPAELPKDGSEADVWYDELLIKGSTVVVIGYNYGLNATEIASLELSPLGRFARRETIYLTSFDYFDTSNYAARIVEGDLVLYVPVEVEVSSHRDSDGRIWPEGASAEWPMRMRYSPGGEVESVEPLFFDLRVYASFQAAGRWPVIHTIVRCPLDFVELRCRATGIIGPGDGTHYISREAFYLWLDSEEWVIDVDRVTTDDYRAWLEEDGYSGRSDDYKSVLYRIPLGVSPGDLEVGAVEVRGYP